jgi:hypothetical protein
MVVFLCAVVVGLIRLFVDGGVVLAVVVRGVLHVGNVTALAAIDGYIMVLFLRVSVLLVVLVSGVLHVVRVPCSRSCRRWWRCSWLCPYLL